MVNDFTHCVIKNWRNKDIFAIQWIKSVKDCTRPPCRFSRWTNHSTSSFGIEGLKYFRMETCVRLLTFGPCSTFCRWPRMGCRTCNSKRLPGLLASVLCRSSISLGQRQCQSRKRKGSSTPKERGDVELINKRNSWASMKEYCILMSNNNTTRFQSFNAFSFFFLALLFASLQHMART